MRRIFFYGAIIVSVFFYGIYKYTSKKPLADIEKSTKIAVKVTEIAVEETVVDKELKKKLAKEIVVEKPVADKKPRRESAIGSILEKRDVQRTKRKLEDKLFNEFLVSGVFLNLEQIEAFAERIQKNSELGTALKVAKKADIKIFPRQGPSSIIGGCIEININASDQEIINFLLDH